MLEIQAIALQDRTFSPPGANRPLVAVVDDDTLMLSALRRLLISAGFSVETYASGAELLASVRLDSACCIVLDASMPGMSGIEVQACVKQRAADVPVIFLSGSGAIRIAVEAMREGAVDFIAKPFDANRLIGRIREAAETHRPAHRDPVPDAVQSRLHSLTPRERNVLELVVAGKTCKQIARVLGGSHRTIEIHRHHIMEKMAARSFADLVRLWLLGCEARLAH